MDKPDSLLPTDSQQPSFRVENLQYHEEARVALELAHQAGDILRQNFGASHDRTSKGRTNFKIGLDDSIDHLARQTLGERFAGYSIYSEEQEAKDTGSELQWLVDPIDGTIPYTLGSSDHTAFSIALAERGVPKLGILEVALKNDTYLAETGKGALRNGEAIHVADTADLQESVIGIDYGKGDRSQIIPLMQRLLSPDGITYPVTYGGSAATLALVADGRLDGYCSLDVEPWDCAAAAVICAEAGAAVTNANGEPWSTRDKSIVVANPTLHAELIKLVQAA